MNKNTIAFLTRSLVDSTGINMWKGLASQVRKDKISMLTVRGSVLNHDTGSIIYHLITDNSFAGVISWASSDVDQKTIDYYKKYVRTPLVCLTFKIAGKPLLITDCKSGLIELIDHLVDVHGFKKIAFIRGPVTHVYAKERYEGYLEGLQKHGIPINEELISQPGGWAISDGAKAIETFMSKGLVPGNDFQAVIAVGDNVAIGAQEALLNKGFFIPQDVAVCGFNGTNDAAWSNPPITSVEMPFFGLGVKGYETLRSIMHGEPVEEEIRYTTKLVLGQSCGCSSASVKRASFSDANTGLLEKVKTKIKNATANFNLNIIEIKRTFESPEWRASVNDSISDLIRTSKYANSPVQKFIEDNMKDLVRSFIEEVSYENSKTEFNTVVTRLLNRYLKESSDFSIWQDIISSIRSSVLPVVQNSPLYAKAENILQQSRILISEFDVRTQKQERLLEARKESMLRNISMGILSCTDKMRLMDLIADSAAKLHINSVYVALYENCQYTEENLKIPEKSRMILAVRNGSRISVGEDGFLFNTTDIIPDSLMTPNESGIFEMESLHFQNTYLGYIVFESPDENGVIYAMLRDQISTALHSALILAERNKSRAELEKTFEAMTTKASFVSSQSERISGNITTISKSMDSVATNIKDISNNISIVTKTVTSANAMITDTNTAIGKLVESTSQITAAVTSINDIAETTNVLALNAAIEAAHAGDAGKGFSVVAKEVKILAAQTMEATQSIQELVEKNSSNTVQAEKVIESTNSAIKQIASLSEDIRNSIEAQVASSAAISTQLQDASSGAEQISIAITEIAELGENLKK